MPSCLHTLDAIALTIAATLSLVAVCGVRTEDTGLAMSTAWSSYSEDAYIFHSRVEAGIYFTLTGFCMQVGDDKSGRPPLSGCHTWTDFECGSDGICKNNQAYMYLNSTLVGCAFSLVLLKLLFQLARCCCCKESRMIACTNVVLSAIAATLLIIATIVYGSLCYFGNDEIVLGDTSLIAQLANDLDLSILDDGGFGPGFFAAVVAAVASVISTVFSLCMLKTNSSPEKKSKFCSCV